MTNNKEKYKVAMCPMCGHVRICHADFNMISICNGVSQKEMPPFRSFEDAKEFIERHLTISTAEEIVKFEEWTNLDPADYHEPTEMNATYSYYTDVEVRAITHEEIILKPCKTITTWIRDMANIRGEITNGQD